MGNGENIITVKLEIPCTYVLKKIRCELLNINFAKNTSPIAASRDIHGSSGSRRVVGIAGLLSRDALALGYIRMRERRRIGRLRLR